MMKLFVLLLLFTCSTTWAQKVTQVKNTKVLLDLDQLQTQKGDDIFCLDNEGKRKGMLKITQIKGNRAIGELVKGDCHAGMPARLRRKGAAAPEQAEAQPEPKPKKKHKRFASTAKAWGVLGGFHYDTANASFRRLGTDYSTSMTGVGFSANLLFDYTLTPSWQFRGLAGIETYNTNGTVTNMACNAGTSNDCSFALMNLSTQGILKYNFSNSEVRPWAGLGLGYIFALTKSSNVIDTSALSTNWLYTIAGGVDIAHEKGTYIPVSVEYSMYPATETVSANYIAIRAGWAKAF